MPDQPPYQPYQQQPQWGAPMPPPSPYGMYPQPGSGRTARNVIIAVAVVVVLFCGGIVGLIALGIHGASKTLDNLSDYPGGPDNPITVQAGQAFDIKGVEYGEGWTIDTTATGYDSVPIKGLVATNNRDDGATKTLSIEVRFLKGTKVLGEVDCRSGVSVAQGQSRDMSCTRTDSSSDISLAGYDKLQVNDSYPDY